MSARAMTYPPALVERVRDLYGSGLTQSEVAQVCGVTQKVIWRLMLRHGLTPRAAIKRDQRGERNHAWRGDEAKYAALHLRVSAIRGNPSRCERCGYDDPDARYEWANLSGNYADVNDYERMCVPCHRRYDSARRPTC